MLIVHKFGSLNEISYIFERFSKNSNCYNSILKGFFIFYKVNMVIA